MPKRDSAVRTRVFDRVLMAEHGYYTFGDLARAMGLSESLISRVRRGEVGINEAFIAGACRAFPGKTLDELFIVEPDTEVA